MTTCATLPRLLNRSVGLSQLAGADRVPRVMEVKQSGIGAPEIVNVPERSPVYAPPSTARADRQSDSQNCTNML